MASTSTSSTRRDARGRYVELTPTAVRYLPAPDLFLRGGTVCSRCGALVIDQDIHTQHHNTQREGNTMTHDKLHPEGDPFIGETYEDRDSRAEGRRVRVESLAAEKGTGEPVTGRYRVVTTVNPRNPEQVGGFTHISADNLRRRFRKVSH